MEDIVKAILNRTVNMGGPRPVKKGTAFTPPFEESVAVSIKRSPHLFTLVRTPKENSPEGDQSFGEGGGETHAADSAGLQQDVSGQQYDEVKAVADNHRRPLTDEEKEFVNEWIRKRRDATDNDISFMDYVNINLSKFRHVSEAVLAIARKKWERFYPDEECIL
jgi:hypothetical protein